MNPTPELTIYTDGGSRGNPGPAAYAYVIQRAGDSDIEEKAFLGRTTNNVAEYTGLIKALEHARHLGATRILVLSDSELMVKQMNGDYRVKNEGLLPLYQQAITLRRTFAFAAIRHIRREQNTQADRLCNEAMDRPDDHPPLPVPLPSNQPTVAPVVVVEEPKPAVDDVREQAVAILTASAERWARGNPATPVPADVWDELWQLLVRTNTVRRRRKQRRPPLNA